MKIKKLQYRNFFSSGKSPVTIEFGGKDKILIVGENGFGKSTISDGICFSLFNQTYKEVNRPTIVNSINGKNCLVEIWFENSGKEYYVKRGIKPDIFEIYENDVLVPQNDTKKEYQNHLETHILQMNFATFKQIVIIGRSGFTPFMKLKADKRRAIVEDILDLQAFSKMNVILKGKIDNNKEELSFVDTKLSQKGNELSSKERNMEFLKKKEVDSNKDVEREKENLNKEFSLITEAMIKITDKVDVINKKIEKVNDFRKAKNTIESGFGLMNTEKCSHEKGIKFYTENDTCPTCQQDIDTHFKEKLITEKRNEVDRIENEIDKRREKLKIVEDKLSEMENLISEKQNLVSKSMVLSGKSEGIQKQISSLVSVSYGDEIQEIYDEMVIIEKDIDQLETEKNTLLKERDKLKLVHTILKDDGLKASIVSKFIPLINKYINLYLEKMNFYVQFEIDENFNEVIKSRYRDIFSYDNFSEGEKSRIDLALLFAWIAIVKSRSAATIDLFILDEVHSSSLDGVGESDLMNILAEYSDTNVVVITHSERMKESSYFNRTLTFSKTNNFSNFIEERT